MLRNLEVKDYTLIDELSIDFNFGLNVITGETGAGKSIVIDALTMVLGNRGNKGNIRQGKNKMMVQALFDISQQAHLLDRCKAFGIPLEEGQLILMRELDQHGKNICRANGIMITVSQLKSLGDDLIDIHGQHEHQSLFKKENHRKLVDAYGGFEGDLEEIKLLAVELKKTKNHIHELEMNEREMEREKENLSFEMKEIKEAHLVLGEDLRLDQERLIFSHQEQLFSYGNQAYEKLQGGNREGMTGILNELGALQEMMVAISQIDQSFHPYLEMLDGFFSEFESLSFHLRNYLDELEYSSGDLDSIEERLATIDRLKRKYGYDIKEVLDYCQTIEDRLKTLSNRDAHLEKYQLALEKFKAEYYRLGQKLYKLRLKSAKQLERSLEAELKDLAMEKAQVKIQIDHDRERISEKGQDQIEFLISVNPGMPLKPLGKVASGGEISRIMLSIKSIFRGLSEVDTMVFDEIDTGISGRTAQIVAEKIQSLAGSDDQQQIICITHLPQIAAMADRHFRVEKKDHQDAVEVSFKCLDKTGKNDELSRMLGGAEVTQITKDHAREMLELSRKFKEDKKSEKKKSLT